MAHAYRTPVGSKLPVTLIVASDADLQSRIMRALKRVSEKDPLFPALDVGDILRLNAEGNGSFASKMSNILDVHKREHLLPNGLVQKALSRCLKSAATEESVHHALHAFIAGFPLGPTQAKWICNHVDVPLMMKLVHVPLAESDPATERSAKACCAFNAFSKKQGKNACEILNDRPFDELLCAIIDFSSLSDVRKSEWKSAFTAARTDATHPLNSIITGKQPVTNPQHRRYPIPGQAPIALRA